MTRRLLVDDIVDPQVWLRSFDSDESDESVCVDAVLNSVNCDSQYLSLEVSCGDRTLITNISETRFKSLTLLQAKDILSKYHGNYLLCALAHEITEGG